MPYQIPPKNLLSAFRNGDEKALETIRDSLHKQLLKKSISFTANELESEDIVSDSFMKAWKMRKTFTSMDSISRYLHTVVKNSSINAGKSNRRQKGVREMLHYLTDKKEEIPFNGMSIEDILRIIYEEIGRLPSKPRQVLTLLLEGHKHHEIAEIMHMLPATVRTNKSRGVEQLRQRLQERGLL